MKNQTLFNKNNYGDESPIAAIATNPGNSALTLIRCSGKGCIELVSSIFKSSKTKPLCDEKGNTVIHGWIVNNENEKIDEVLISIFRSPKSYTSEDSLDISCHGGYVIANAVMTALKAAGLRDALPGEFTFRAFINGKIDLTQSESVMELVSAKTDTGRQHALFRLSGSLEKEISKIKELLVQVLASTEIFLDYSEDEISADGDEIAGKLPNKEIALSAMKSLEKLSASWQFERLYQEGVIVVIAGRPNAGKSSLFNALLKEDRSIVTEIPGTTRDWIEAQISANGIPIRLIDTAGLRDSTDAVEKIGVERTHKILEEADIILYLIDGTQEATEEDRKFIEHYTSAQNNKKTILILKSKSDLDNLIKASENEKNMILYHTMISFSAKTGDGLAEIFSQIDTEVKAQAGDGEFSISLGTERQKKLVDAACLSLEEALVLSEKEEPLDIIAPLLREAVNLLGEITGEVSTSDILEEMFSKFCVGK